MSASSSSRWLAIFKAVSASTFKRSKGSVFEARMLNHQVADEMVRPSSSSMLYSGKISYFSFIF